LYFLIKNNSVVVIFFSFSIIFQLNNVIYMSDIPLTFSSIIGKRRIWKKKWSDSFESLNKNKIHNRWWIWYDKPYVQDVTFQ
jgi:hypothetical protein